MNRRVAVIDIGTNSILYLLVEKNGDGRLDCAFQQMESTRLGENLDATGKIAPRLLAKAVSVIARYRDLARSQKAEKLAVVGTHLFRTAANRESVVQTLFHETGMEVRVLSENEEAEWSHRGAVYGRAFAGPVISADIGGGSTEIVLGLADQIAESASAPLGAVSLTERFLSHDPPTPDELTALEICIASSVENRFGSILAKGKRLVVTGGTPTTLAALDLGLTRYDPERVDGHDLSEVSITRFLKALAGVNLAERRKRLALDPKRADIILGGTAILRAILKTGPFRKAMVSDRGLRFGIALKEFNPSS